VHELYLNQEMHNNQLNSLHNQLRIIQTRQVKTPNAMVTDL
jgi:hypothetical protein